MHNWGRHGLGSQWGVVDGPVVSCCRFHIHSGAPQTVSFQAQVGHIHQHRDTSQLKPVHRPSRNGRNLHGIFVHAGGPQHIWEENIISIVIVWAGDDTTVAGGTFPVGWWSTIEGSCIDGYIRERVNLVGH